MWRFALCILLLIGGGPALAGEIECRPSAAPSLKTAEEIFIALFRSFSYVSDQEQFGVEDDKRSYAHVVRCGGKFRDDCDGFALTARDLLQAAGYQAWVVTVDQRKVSPDSKNVSAADYGTHMFAAFLDVDGVVKTLDNRYVGIRTYDNTISGSRYRNPVIR